MLATRERRSGARRSHGELRLRLVPGARRDAQTLFRLADEALYEAKRAGSGLPVRRQRRDRAVARTARARAEVRPLRARLGRARHLGEGAERPLGLARLLDRRRLARRARRPRRRLALHRAPALQGLALVRRAADRRDVRRDGRRAERGDLARAHRRLLARARPARRGGARGDDRHGLRAAVRRARPGARGRARGDRDVRGHAAGARARSLLARRSSARTRSAGR